MARASHGHAPAAGRQEGFRRALAVTLAAGLGLLILLGMVFSIAYGSQQITSKATGLHDADETLRSATVVRAQLGLAVHMASVDEAVGTTSSEAIDHSIAEAGVALGDLRKGVIELEKEGLLENESLRSGLEAFDLISAELLDLVEARDVENAKQLSTSLDSQFQTVVGDLEGIRDELASSVEASDELLGHIGDVTRFLVAFLVPAGVIFVYRTILRRQQRQRDLERRLDLERELGRSREEFIATASHELRTPLTGIMGLAHMLAEDPLLDGSNTASELLDMIILESGDLARMVEDLLTTARLDAGALHFSFEDVDVSEVVREVVDPVAKTNQRINYECASAYLRVDELRLRQVLRNLLSNARKYGGPNIDIEGYVEGRTYVCAVRDDGPGIPTEIADNLFTRFVHQDTGSALKGSVGLGLSIVHALTQGMGGNVSYARVGGRTEFMVRLPLSVNQSHVVEVAGDSDAGTQFSEFDANSPSGTSLSESSTGELPL